MYGRLPYLEGGLLNCYVVRIYREKPNDPREFVGIIEDVGRPGRQTFTNVDELWEILNPAGSASREEGNECR
jgi:hypothetical protein